jgi:hypothetical protein
VQAFYGNYAFPPNCVIPQTRKRTTFAQDGSPASVENTIECTGEFLGTGQRDLVNQCTLLELALGRQWQDFRILCDDGTAAIYLPNATAFGGVRVIEGPDYPEGAGVEFAVKRKFRFVVQATYPITAAGLPLLVTYEETVSFRGGGPLIVWMQPVNGPPIRQIAAEATPYYATQSGNAVGLLGWPAPPFPLWSGALMTAPQISRTTPQVLGTSRRNFKITWNYEFASVVNLNNRGPTLA